MFFILNISQLKEPLFAQVATDGTVTIFAHLFFSKVHSNEIFFCLQLHYVI